MINISKGDFLKELAKNNDEQYNFNKSLEESAEFQEVLLKYITKHPDVKPDKKEILKEYSDFIYRGLITLLTLFPEKSQIEIMEDINKHINKKLSKLEALKLEGAHKGKL